MTYVLGVDLSLTCSGVAAITHRPDGPTIETYAVESSGRQKAPLPERHHRIAHLADRVLDHAGQPDLAVVEATIAASFAGGAVLDRHGLWWAVVGGLIERDVPIATVVPSALKKAITDNGKADKAVVAAELLRLWPDLRITSSDVADAAGLAHLGAVRLGWPVQTLARHRRVVAVWPADLPDPLPDPTEETP